MKLFLDDAVRTVNSLSLNNEHNKSKDEHDTTYINKFEWMRG